VEDEIVVESEDVGVRIDVFLTETIENLSRSGVQKLIESENILVNNKSTKSNYKLRFEDTIFFKIPEPEILELLAENIHIDIVYEDKDIVVVNKAKGMVVHPAPGHYSGTLVNALMYHCGENLSAINGVMRPGIVHRIDKDTSGVIVVAKSDSGHRGLAKQFADHSITRLYNGIAINNIKNDKVTIDRPIGRHPTDRKKMCVTNKNSKNAITHIQVIERFTKYTFIEASLETGRTHQIRVHMSSIGNPLLGDTVYGKEKQSFGLSGQVLHAKVLGFHHPITGEYKEFSSDLPENFKFLLNKIKE